MATKHKIESDGVFFEGGGAVHFGFEGDTRSKIVGVKVEISKSATNKGQTNLVVTLAHQGKQGKGLKLTWYGGLSGSLKSGAKKADATLSNLATGLSAKAEDAPALFKKLAAALKKGEDVLKKELMGKIICHTVVDGEVINPKTKRPTGRLRTEIPLGGLKAEADCDFDGTTKSAPSAAKAPASKGKGKVADDDDEDLPIEDEDEDEDVAVADDEDEDSSDDEEEEEEDEE